METRGKTAVVTGAASGIGRATVLALAREGARVLACDIDDAGNEETVRLARSAGGTASAFRADVSQPAGVESLIAAAEARYGGVDIVHNNAGIMSGGAPGWPDLPLEKIQRVVAVNVAGVLMGTQEAIWAMRRRGGGCIVNTASIAGLNPMPFDPIYAASKAAVILFTRSCVMLKDTEHIRVNAVLPGMVDTAIINKTGDGSRPAEWLGPALAGAVLLDPAVVADAVLDFVRDDSLAGETRVIMHGTAAATSGS